MKRLISDNDGHWFVISIGDTDLFLEWVLACESGEKWQGKNFDVVGVDSPGSICFSTWETR